MTKITVVGNSHVAALKTAWDGRESGQGDVKVTFFALPDSTFLKARMGTSTPNRFGVDPVQNALDPVERARALAINGALDTDLSDAEVIVRAGDDWGMAALAMIVSTYAIAGLSDLNLPHKMTRPTFDAMCDSLARATLPDPPMADVDARIVTVLRPIPSAGCLCTDASLHPDLRLLRKLHESGAHLKSIFDVLFARIKAVHHENGHVTIEPPAEVHGESGLTLQAFSQDSTGLAKNPHGNEDFRHMNGKYGQLVWDRLLEVL